MKKRLVNVILGMSMFLTSIPSHAGDFFFGLSSEGTNFWFVPTQIPVNLTNLLLGGGLTSISYDWISVKDSQGKVKVDNGNFFGFQAKDIFNHFGYGITFGYQPPFSPFGIFANGGYKFRQFRMQPDRLLEDMEKYKLNSWSAGLGVRVTPMIGLLEDAGWSPIVEIGTDYHQVFSCKAPYENSKDQFGSGFSTHLAAGVRLIGTSNRSTSITVAFELPNYDYFNKDFELPNGDKPYADIKSKNYHISIGFKTEF